MLLTRAPLYSSAEADFLVRLACVRHAASVRAEPGSNSSGKPRVLPPYSVAKLARGFKLLPLSSPHGDFDFNYNLTTQTHQALFNKGLLHPSEMLLIIHHLTAVVKSFYKEPSTWVPQTALLL